MNRWRTTGYLLAFWLTVGLGAYELTAKSPPIAGAALPARWAADRAERATLWRPLTGLFPLDKLLHEGEEAARFYATLVRHRPSAGAQFR